jgi:hypothetical protein
MAPDGACATATCSCWSVGTCENSPSRWHNSPRLTPTIQPRRHSAAGTIGSRKAISSDSAPRTHVHRNLTNIGYAGDEVVYRQASFRRQRINCCERDQVASGHARLRENCAYLTHCEGFRKRVAGRSSPSASFLPTRRVRALHPDNPNTRSLMSASNLETALVARGFPSAT